MTDIPAIPTSKSFYVGLLVYGIVYCIAISFGGQSNISKDYILPKRFDLIVEDLDDNGQNEVVATYNGRKCLFMEDGNGMPVLKGYQVVDELKDGKITSKLEILAECK